MIIKIFGGNGEGKSTLATWLEDELKRRGIQVTNHDRLADPAQLTERFAVLGNSQDPLKVEIKTIPYGAESLPAYTKGSST